VKKEPPDGHSSGGKAELYTQVIIALSLVGRQPAAFAVPSRGFDLDQVERAFKPPSVYVSVYVCRAALLVCPFWAAGSFGLPLSEDRGQQDRRAEEAQGPSEHHAAMR